MPLEGAWRFTNQVDFVDRESQVHEKYFLISVAGGQF